MRRYLNLSVAMVAIVLLIIGTQIRSAVGLGLTTIGAAMVGALAAALDRLQERDREDKAFIEKMDAGVMTPERFEYLRGAGEASKKAERG